MATIDKRTLKGFVRIDGSGRSVPNSLIFRKSKPKVGKWIEIDVWECCTGTTTTTTTVIVPTTTTTTTVLSCYTYEMTLTEGTGTLIYNDCDGESSGMLEFGGGEYPVVYTFCALEGQLAYTGEFNTVILLDWVCNITTTTTTVAPTTTTTTTVAPTTTTTTTSEPTTTTTTTQPG
jgi:hypothetical protein